MRSLFRLMLVVCLALFTAGPHVLAQNDNASVYSTARPGANTRGPLDWLFGRRPAPAAAPRADARPKAYQPRKRTVSAPRPVVPAAPTLQIGPDGQPIAPAESSVPQTADVAPVAPQPVMAPVNVAVVGDSLAVFLAQGLQEIYAERPAVTFVKRNRESSGLVRDDYFDWPKSLKDLVSTSDKLDAIIVMIGSNDRQQLKDDQGVHEPRSEIWRQIYARRIDTMIGIAREKGAALIWVGLPIMRSEKYSADLLAFNDLYKARAQAAGVPFIDVWEAFAGEDGHYVVTGPDVGGEIVRLRTQDGVHFTRAGARKLGFFADKELQKIVAAIQAKAAPAGVVPALPQPQPAPSSVPGDMAMLPAPPVDVRIPPALQSIDVVIGVALPDRPLPSTLTPRPAQGAVVGLTAAPVTPGAQLLGISVAPQKTDASQLFVQGRMTMSKPGRLDDFSAIRD